MENATKALIMAGTVLISILLISFLVLFLRKGASASAEYHNAMSDAELAKFNSQFEVYDKENNTYFDVITVVNLAYSINKTNENDSQNQINVILLDNYNHKTYNIDNSSPHSIYYTSAGTNTKIDIYSLVNTYTELKWKDNSDHSQGKIYEYLFKCSGGGNPGIIYDNVTGKVKEIKFIAVKNL